MIKPANNINKNIEQSQDNHTEPTSGIKISGSISPLIEHGLTALIFCVGGYWVMINFNESPIGFLGIAMMLWGGLFKGIILLSIYGFALYALIFHRDWFEHVLERNHIRKIETRILEDREEGHMRRSEDRLHALLSIYPDNMHLRRKLATLLIEREAFIAAGKIIALHPAPTKDELIAIGAFCKSNGHDPFQIMRKAMKTLQGIHLARASQKKLLDLHLAISRKTDKHAWQWRAIERYLQSTILRPWWRMLYEEYRNTMIELAIAITILITLGMWI